MTVLCIWLRNILRKWFVTTVLTLRTHVLQPHKILCGFSVMIQKTFFRVFQLFAQEVKYFYQKNTRKNSKIVFKKQKWFKTWNNFGKELVSEGVEAAYIARTSFFIYNGLKGCVWLLLVVVATKQVPALQPAVWENLQPGLPFLCNDSGLHLSFSNNSKATAVTIHQANQSQ